MRSAGICWVIERHSVNIILHVKAKGFIKSGEVTAHDRQTFRKEGKKSRAHPLSFFTS
jgi:hypothetical protein